MDIISINTALQSIGKGLEIVHTVLNINKDTAVNTKLSELVKEFIILEKNTVSIQADYQAALNKMQLLEKELEYLKRWNESESDYELYRLFSGSFVYIDKSKMNKPYTTVWYCPNCFLQKKKSLLQIFTINQSHICPICNCKILINPRDVEKRNSESNI